VVTLSSADVIEVCYTPKTWGPYSDGPTVSEEEDDVIILSARDKFMYMIPSFDILAFPLRHLKIKGFLRQDEQELIYDVFIRIALPWTEYIQPQ